MGRNAETEVAALARAAASSYWTQAEARVVLGAQEASGLSMREFARRHGLKPQRLRWWKSRVDRQETGPALSFVPVKVVPSAPALLPPSPPPTEAFMEVVLAGGRRIRVTAGFEERALARLVRTLEESC